MEKTLLLPPKRSGPHTAPKLRTVVLSDLHLGRTTTHAHSPEVIAPLVQGFERVLLLGDIIDHWYTHDHHARAMKQRIKTICKNAGVKQLVYFRGNHDACLGGEEYALFDGVLYLHGHAVYHSLAGTGNAEARIHALNQKKFGPVRTASRNGRPIWTAIDRVYSSIPMAMLNPIAWPWPVVRRIRALIDEVAPSGGVKAVVLGHTHRPGVRHVGKLSMFNLGGWLKNTRAYAFVHEGNHAKLVHIDNRAKQLCWGETLYEGTL